MTRRDSEESRRPRMAVAALAFASALLALAAVALAVICTPALAIDDALNMAPSIQMTRVAASGADQYVEIANSRTESQNLRNWVLSADGAEAALPPHLLEPGRMVRVHLGLGRDNQTDLFLKSDIRLNQTAGSLTLWDDRGGLVASLQYQVQPDGSTIYTMAAKADFEYLS